MAKGGGVHQTGSLGNLFGGAGSAKLGVEAVFEDTQARKNMQRYERALERMERAANKLQKAAEANAKKRITDEEREAKAAEKAAKAAEAAARKIQRAKDAEAKAHERVAKAAERSRRIQEKAAEDAAKAEAKKVAQFEKYLSNWAKQEEGFRKDKAREEMLAEKETARSYKEQEKHARRFTLGLRQIKWELMSMVVMYRILSRAVQQAFESMRASAEGMSQFQGAQALVGGYGIQPSASISGISKVVGSTMTTKDQLKVVLSGILEDQGKFVSEYDRLWKAARYAAVVTGKDAQEIFQAFVKDLVSGTGAATDAAAPFYNLGGALQEYAYSSGRLVEQLSEQERTQVQLNRIQEVSNVLVKNGADEALDSVEKWKSLDTAWTNFKDSLAGAVESGGPLSLLVSLLTAATQSLIMFTAAWEVAANAIPSGLEWFFGGVVGMPRTSLELSRAIAGSPSKEFNEAMKKRMKMFQAQGGMTGGLPGRATSGIGALESKDISAMLDHLQKRQDLIDEHNRRVADIERNYNNRRQDIERNFSQSVARIRRDAARDRDRAMRASQKELSDQLQEHLTRMRHYEEDFYMKRKHDQQKFQMDQMHSEAAYQYQRALLVAEGDVLAIEDLDARHQLEEQERTDNFNLQQRQEQEFFEQQQRQRQEMFDAQLRQLQDTLQERLAEINAREQEQIQEAKDRRVEELAEAKEDRDQNLADERDSHQESLRQWNEYWAELADAIGLNAKEIANIIRSYFGSGGEADTIIGDFMNRQLQKANMLSQLLRSIATSTGSSTRVGIVRNPNRPHGRATRSYQYGTENEIVSSPRMISVGERPEVFSVRPIANNYSMTVSWGGGTIPVQGRGSMEGVDLNAIGDAMAQGLLLTLRDSFRR